MLTYEELIEAGKRAYSYNDVGAATVYYQEAFKEKIILDDYIMLGYMYKDVHEHIKAQIVFRNVRKALGTPDAYYALGETIVNQGKDDEAIEHYKRVVYIFPKFQPGHFSYAELCDKKSDYAKEDIDGYYTKIAIKEYELSIKCDPTHFESYMNLGALYERININDKALECFHKAYKLEPDEGTVCYNLGVVYAKLERYENAIQSYLDELKKYNFYELAYYNLAILYKDYMFDYEKAKFNYLKLLKLQPENYDGWYNLMCLYSIMGDYENANECFVYLFYKKPEYIEYMNEDEELNGFVETEYYKSKMV